MKNTTILCILDGFGYSMDPEGNAIMAAKTSVISNLYKDYPFSLLEASGEAIGLPHLQMGNSEVGHMTIGAGRRIVQNLPRISKAVTDNTLAINPAVSNLIQKFKNTDKICHILGLVSDGGVHSHIEHIIAVINILKAANVRVMLHAITDGRDTAPKAALSYIKQIKQQTNVDIPTISGRYYTMDRDNRWDRVKLAVDTIVNAAGDKYHSAEEVIEKSYKAGIYDEFIVPHSCINYKGIQNGDALLCTNFRADRVRQILTALLDSSFNEFNVGQYDKIHYAVGMTSYSTELDKLMDTIFGAQSITNSLGQVLADAGKTQLRIAETEKYAHVTYFLSCGRDEKFIGEERIMIPSPKVKSYDLQPEMSAFELTDRLIASIGKYDFICVNYANADMVGHTGDIIAAKKAIVALDKCLIKLINASKNHSLFITADHGNIEKMFDSKGIITSHTLNKVPFIYVGKNHIKLKNGALYDIAPTMLAHMGIDIAKEMSGTILTINKKTE